MDRLISWLKSNYACNENCGQISVMQMAKNGVYNYDMKYNVLYIIFRETGVFTTLTKGEDGIWICHATYNEPPVDGEEVTDENIISNERYDCETLAEAIRLFNKLSLQSLPVPTE